MSKIPQALVITGEGFYGAKELEQAFQMARFSVQIHHFQDLLLKKIRIDEVSAQYAVIAFSGGYSFLENLKAGQLAALKIRYQLCWDLNTFAQRGGLVLGVGYGFQVLLALGCLGSEVSTTTNRQGTFLNAWVKVTPQGGRCVWLKGLGTFELPIGHRQGRIVISHQYHADVVEKMKQGGFFCLRYEHDVNGSTENLAGLCDSTGRILGLMPHPERCVRWTSHPEWTDDPDRAYAPGHGLILFENAYQVVVDS